MANGTLSMRASVCASSVLPQPVGPSSRMLLLASSTSSSVGLGHRLTRACSGCRRRPTAPSWRAPGRRRTRRGPRGSRWASAGRRAAAAGGLLGELVLDDVVAQVDALVADVDARPGDELADVALALAAERALELLRATGTLGSGPSATRLPSPCGSRARRRRGRTPWPPRPIMMLSRSVSSWIFSTVWPGVLAPGSRRAASRIRSISLAWISMSVTWPCVPPHGWWMRMRRVRQREALARARRRRAAPRAIEAHWPMQIVDTSQLDELHRVVDRQAGGDRAARRVDVEVDVLVRIVALQVQQLRDHEVGDVVVDLACRGRRCAR